MASLPQRSLISSSFEQLFSDVCLKLHHMDGQGCLCRFELSGNVLYLLARCLFFVPVMEPRTRASETC